MEFMEFMPFGGSQRQNLVSRFPLHLLQMSVAFYNLCCTTQLSFHHRVAGICRIRHITRRPGLCRRGCKGLFEVGNDVVDVLRANRYPNQIFRHSTATLLLVAQLLVCCRPWVNCKSLAVSDTVADERSR